MRTHSVFHDLEAVCENFPDETPPKVQIEFVGKDPEHPDKVFFVVNGQRMAERENGQWVSLVPGFDNPEDTKIN